MPSSLCLLSAILLAATLLVLIEASLGICSLLGLEQRHLRAASEPSTKADLQSASLFHFQSRPPFRVVESPPRRTASFDTRSIHLNHPFFFLYKQKLECHHRRSRLAQPARCTARLGAHGLL
ncbi:uncharacterized protein UDID_18344 [Ustilago sp. UG-2017a]|nr:uncharacterized protein UDID_18344 [Ustilago sp. UG-2017a]